MSFAQTPLNIYKLRIEEFTLQLNDLRKKRNLLGWLRLIIVVVSIVLAYQVFISVGFLAWVIVAIAIILFLVLVTLDANNNAKIINVKNILQINEDELAILDHQFNNRYDGKEMMPAVHSFAGDLDVFGPFSLFQYINRCYTEQGKPYWLKTFYYH